MAHQFSLNEPIVKALQKQLAAQMPAAVAAVNADLAAGDPYAITPPVQVYDYVPLGSVVSAGGFPAIGIEDMPSRFENDLVYSVDGVHRLAIVAFITNPDPEGLVWQLRRYQQAIAAAVNADRTLAGNAYTTRLIGIDPGPMLEPADRPSTDGENSYLSWFAFNVECPKAEV